MTEKTATEHRLTSLESAVERLNERFGFMERATWWLIGAGTGVGALATAVASGVLKRLAT